MNTEIPVTLTHAKKTETILLGYMIGSAETDLGKLQVIGCGSTVRFNLEGREGHVDLDLGPVASLAFDLLKPQPNALARTYIAEFGDNSAAYKAFVDDLMRGNPADHQAGYSEANAVIAAAEAFDVSRSEVRSHIHTPFEVIR